MSVTGGRFAPAAGSLSACLVLAMGLLAPGVAAQEHAGAYAQADIQVGLGIYTATCITCHGPNGDLVPGVTLRGGEYERAPSDDDLEALIRAGIPGTAMPPGEYSEAELTGLVAYLRSMRDVDPRGVVLGDAERGQRLYAGEADCARCHRVDGVGSRLGPDLSDVGATRTAGLLERALLDPTGSMFPINRPVRVVTTDGRTYSGRRVNEDTHTVQILDQNERLRSFDTDELREYTVLTESPMPAYGDTLSAEQISHLVAYLLTLRGLEP